MALQLAYTASVGFGFLSDCLASRGLHAWHLIEELVALRNVAITQEFPSKT
jgi:hypothetical protein